MTGDMTPERLPAPPVALDAHGAPEPHGHHHHDPHALDAPQASAPAATAPEACAACCTRIEGLGVAISGRTILHDVDIHLHCGELTVIVGPNGAGKTTLLRAVAGLVPCTGRVVFEDFGRGRTGRPTIGYVPQAPSFDRSTPASVQDLFSAAFSRRAAFTGASRRSRAFATACLERTGAAHLLRREISRLSGGELQRVMLALALEPSPNLLLLDEPVSGMDIRGRDAFYGLLEDLRCHLDLSVLLVSHDMAAATEHADRLILLDGTVLADGPPAEVAASAAYLERLGPAPHEHVHRYTGGNA
jgi:zinc transport system ATP-binding protein